mgnify:CR=1 FL=1|tara:strand:- start:11477 stop:15340 length:3864 start_codon:yes stop_codon:yes gene_type:complete
MATQKNIDSLREQSEIMDGLVSKQEKLSQLYSKQQTAYEEMDKRTTEAKNLSKVLVMNKAKEVKHQEKLNNFADKYEKTLKKVERAQQRMNMNIDKVSGKFADMARNVPFIGDNLAQSIEDGAEDAKKAMGSFFDKSMTQQERMKKGFKGMGSVVKMVFGGLIMAAIGGIFSFIFQQIQRARDLMYEIDSAATGVQRSLKLSGKGVANLTRGLSGVKYYGDAFASSMTAVQESMGFLPQLTAKEANLMARLNKNMGLGADTIASMYKNASRMNMSFDKYADHVDRTTKMLNEQMGTNFTIAEIQEEIAKAGDDVLAMYQKENGELEKQVMLGKKIGLNLSQQAKMARGLLDIESSLEAQMEAQMLTGKQLNFDKARQLALEGDTAGASKAILDQVGGVAEFNKMNILQKEAIAKAAGLEVGELEKSLETREKIAAGDQMAGDTGTLAQGAGNVSASEAKEMREDAIASQFSGIAEKIENIKKNIQNFVLKHLPTVIDFLEKNGGTLLKVAGVLTGAYILKKAFNSLKVLFGGRSNFFEKGTMMNPMVTAPIGGSGGGGGDFTDMIRGAKKGDIFKYLKKGFSPKNITRTLNRGIIKGFGKSGFKTLARLGGGSAIKALSGAAGLITTGVMVAKDLSDASTSRSGRQRGAANTGAAGAATGAALGAAIGSVIPGVGTLLGAGVGAGIGYLTGKIIGSSDAFANSFDKASEKLDAAFKARTDIEDRLIGQYGEIPPHVQELMNSLDEASNANMEAVYAQDNALSQQQAAMEEASGFFNDNESQIIGAMFPPEIAERVERQAQNFIDDGGGTMAEFFDEFPHYKKQMYDLYTSGVEDAEMKQSIINKLDEQMQDDFSSMRQFGNRLQDVSSEVGSFSQAWMMEVMASDERVKNKAIDLQQELYDEIGGFENATAQQKKDINKKVEAEMKVFRQEEEKKLNATKLEMEEDYGKTWWGRMGDFASEKWAAAAEWAKGAWDSISGWASGVWDSVSTWASGAWESTKNFASNAWEKTKGFASSAWENTKTFASNTWNSIGDMASSVWSSISSFAGGVWDSITGFASDCWDGISGVATDVWDSVSGTATEVWDSVSGTATAAWDGIQNAGTAVYNAMPESWQNSLDSIVSKAGDMWDSVKGMASGVWDSVSGWAEGAFDKAKSLVSNAWEGAKDVGSSIIDTLVFWDDGIITSDGTMIQTDPADYIMATKNPFKSFAQGIAGGAGKVFDAVGSIFGDESEKEDEREKDRNRQHAELMGALHALIRVTKEGTVTLNMDGKKVGETVHASLAPRGVV